jgi:hypothetical protein
MRRSESEPELFTRRSPRPAAKAKKRREAEAAAQRFQQSYQRLLPKDPAPPAKGKK